jgi:hypothetical protein
VVPAGGLSPDHQRWIPSRYRFFLPVKVLRRVFRGKFVDALKRAFADGQLGFYGDLKLLAEAKAFASFLRPLFWRDWVVYCKPPFGGPEYVLRYLGRYTHRVAISNHRLVSLQGNQVTFRWRDSALKGDYDVTREFQPAVWAGTAAHRALRPPLSEPRACERACSREENGDGWVLPESAI